MDQPDQVRTSVDDAEDLATRLYNFETELINDPFPVYKLMREQRPVLRVGPIVIVSRYEDVKAVFRDTVNFSNRRTLGSRVTAKRATLTGEDLEMYNFVINKDVVMIGQSDEPDHTRLRRFVNNVFSVAVVNAMRADVETLANELLDEIEARGEDVFDFAEFTYRLPFTLVCRLLDVPEEDIPLFRQWASEIRTGLGTNYENLADAYAATVKVEEFVGDLIRRRRAQPPGSATDLIGQLVYSDADAVGLTNAELESLFTVMLTTGNTNDMISNAIIALDDRPDQRRLLIEDPALLRNAVEEFFRFCPAAHGVHRVVMNECEIAGFAVYPGETVRLVVASANHDESVFANAEVLDIQRKNARQHVDFGFGIHTCLGQWLARMEIDVALQTLFRRYPDLHVAGDFSYRRNYQFHGPERLMVRTR